MATCVTGGWVGPTERPTDQQSESSVVLPTAKTETIFVTIEESLKQHQHICIELN